MSDLRQLSLSPPRMSRATGRLEALRRQVEAIERGETGDTATPGIRFGLQALDALLPERGLPRAALHEILPASVEWDDGPALGFALALLARLTGDVEGPLIWLTAGTASDLHAPALGRFGIDHRRLLHLRCPDDGETLWAMEQALNSAVPAAVAAEFRSLPRAGGARAARRLQLAAEASGRPALLLHRPRRVTAGRPLALAAASRWRISAQASSDSSRMRPAWRVELLRCRGGRTAAPEDGALRMEWNDATGDFAMAAPIRDRQAAA
jgi:protein ImuA